MIWFRITLIEVELPAPPTQTLPQGVNPPLVPPVLVRHPSTNGRSYLPPYPFQIHHEQSANPVNAMIGVRAGSEVSFPVDWVPLTLDEARALFETFFGFPPSPNQVF